MRVSGVTYCGYELIIFLAQQHHDCLMFHKDADKQLKLYESAQFNILDNKGKKGFENPPTLWKHWYFSGVYKAQIQTNALCLN